MKTLWYLAALLAAALSLLALGIFVKGLVAGAGLEPRQLGIVLGCLMMARGARRKARERRPVRPSPKEESPPGPDSTSAG